MDSTQGLVSNHRVQRLPTRSQATHIFTLFTVARNTAEPLLLCNPGACCTHTPQNCDHTPDVLLPPVFRSVSSIFPRVVFYSVPHTYGHSCFLLPSLRTPMHLAVPVLSLLCYALYLHQFAHTPTLYITAQHSLRLSTPSA